MRLTETDRPLANTMWDFSWIERRYPGGGYDNWDRALDELAERDLLVGLTTWFRGTDRYEGTKVETPQEWGEIRIETLDHLENEFGAASDWISGESHGPRHTKRGKRWMNESVETVRETPPTWTTPSPSHTSGKRGTGRTSPRSTSSNFTCS